MQPPFAHLTEHRMKKKPAKKKKAAAKKTAPKRTAAAKKSPATKKAAPVADTAKQIDQRFRDIGGWRGETLARMRKLILEADRDMVEEVKWVKPTNPFGVPVWSHDGIVCTGETYAKVVKLTFAQGANVPDPSRLFNASLEGNTRRAIDIHEGEKIDARAFKALVKAAVARNELAAKKRG